MNRFPTQTCQWLWQRTSSNQNVGNLLSSCHLDNEMGRKERSGSSPANVPRKCEKLSHCIRSRAVFVLIVFLVSRIWSTTCWRQLDDRIIYVEQMFYLPFVFIPSSLYLFTILSGTLIGEALEKWREISSIGNSYAFSSKLLAWCNSRNPILRPI